MKCRRVQIQELESITEEVTYEYDSKLTWKQKKCEHWRGDCKCNLLYYMENCRADAHISSNNFYGAFLCAYNNHGDIVLSPDDVWLTICFQFSKYINDNAEKVRDMFVDHEGQKKLTVTSQQEWAEADWEEFFDLIIQLIAENTKNNIAGKLKSDFTTSGRIETIMSTALVMDSFQKYFSYGRCIPCCGIRAVRFLGTEDDWIKLLTKMDTLAEYDIGEWKNYTEQLRPILLKFLDTYRGDVDVDFWNKVMNITHGRLGSGSTTYISGWILNFFGIYKKVEDDEIKNISIDIPIEIVNKLTGEKKMVNLLGGFGGVNICDGAYRPQMSLAIFHDGNIEKLD